MKKLFVISALLVSILTFGQETSASWSEDLHSFNVNLPQGQKFKYVDPKTYTTYNNMSVGNEETEDTATVIKLFGLKTKEEVKKYYIAEKINKAQVITGSYWFSFNKESIANVNKIVKECSSTQELVNKMKPINDQPMIRIENFGDEKKGDVYYTISDFYYTIEPLQNGEYMLYVIFPIEKDRTLKN
jgi:hypothetical protein